MADAARPAAHSAVLLVALALAAAAAGAALPQTEPGTAGIQQSDAGTGAVDDGVGLAGDAADPTLAVPESVNRSSNLTATLSLPETADEPRRFVVRIERVSGGTVANRTLSVAPGETATVDFGACLATTNYLVQVATPDGDVLVADQVQVEQVTPLVALGDADPLRSAFEPTVTRNETLSVTARLHPCVDRATVSLSPREDASAFGWRATVVDANDDGQVAFEWDVDAASDAVLVAGTGTDLANVTVDGPAPYGEYDLRTTTGDGDGRSGRVRVSFANPRVSVYAADGQLTASEAIEAARDDEPLRNDHTVRVLDGNWVVLRFDVDGTLDSLPANASLVAPSRHENATVRVRDAYGGPETGGAEVDLANATRAFDAASGALWYAYRANQTDDRNVFEYAAVGGTWNATARTSVQAVDAVILDVDDGDLLAPDVVELAGSYRLSRTTNLTVSVRTSDGVLASERVAVDRDVFRTRLDLSGVANGTNASVVVAQGDRVLYQRAVVVASKPVLVLHETDAPEDLFADRPVTVHAFVLNRGTAPGNATVAVSLGNVTRTRTTTVPAGEDAVVEVRFPASDVPDGGAVPVVVSMGDQRVQGTASIYHPTTPPPTPSSTTTAATTEPWPTLADGERRPANDPLPGFGPVAALVALAATVALVARRLRPALDGEGD